jgi:hypothetical protein
MGWFDCERARVDDCKNLFGMFLDGKPESFGPDLAK